MPLWSIGSTAQPEDNLAEYIKNWLVFSALGTISAFVDARVKIHTIKVLLGRRVVVWRFGACFLGLLVLPILRWSPRNATSSHPLPNRDGSSCAPGARRTITSISTIVLVCQCTQFPSMVRKDKETSRFAASTDQSLLVPLHALEC